MATGFVTAWCTRHVTLRKPFNSINYAEKIDFFSILLLHWENRCVTINYKIVICPFLCPNPLNSTADDPRLPAQVISIHLEIDTAMKEYYFANYRLCVDDEIARHPIMDYLENFVTPMDYTHTFTVHLGDSDRRQAVVEEIQSHPTVCRCETFTIHDCGDTWGSVWRNPGFTQYAAMISSRDYSEMTMYPNPERAYWGESYGYVSSPMPFVDLGRLNCESGMALSGGMPLHASLVEKDGWGYIFLGPSGMGKSTQAKLWVKYQNADFIIGDRPGLRKVGDTWVAFGMPWDGKDSLFCQKGVKVKALVALQQAPVNEIRRLSTQEAFQVLLNQAMMPMWDDAAMGGIMLQMAAAANEIPFYHLKNRPEEAATQLTYQTIWEDQ